jgi:hypothetical protein
MMDEINRLTDAELRDLREFVETVLTICERDSDLAVEIEALALTAAEILGVLEEDEDDEV